MNVCLPACVSKGKPTTGYTNGCGKKRAKGGIPRLLFLTCDPNYVHPVEVEEGVSPWTNDENVIAAMCAGILNFTGPVLGSLDRPTFVKKKMTSCDPEEVIGGSTVINVEDYNVTTDEDGNPTLEEFDFWPWIGDNYEYLSVGWVTCDELIYLYDGTFVPEVALSIENSSDGSRFFSGPITLQTEKTVRPFHRPGILALLANFNAATCSYS